MADTVAGAHPDTAVEVDTNPLDEFHEKLDAFKALRTSDQAAADALLAALGGRGQVEEEMILQLAAWKPLYRPGEFEGAHHNAMRALEVLVVLYVVLFALGWCLLRGAAVARTRIKLALDDPLRILWDAVGAAGKPPKDQAMSFALYAFIILGFSAVVVPIVVAVLFVR